MIHLKLSRDNLVITKDQFINALIKCAEDKGCKIEVLCNVIRELPEKLKLITGTELKIDYERTTVFYAMLEDLGLNILYLPNHLTAVVLGTDVVVRTPWTDKCFLNSLKW